MKRGALNHEQARFYRGQGYYRLTDAFTTEESSEIRQFIENEADKQARDVDPLNPNKKTVRSIRPRSRDDEKSHRQ